MLYQNVNSYALSFDRSAPEWSAEVPELRHDLQRNARESCQLEFYLSHGLPCHKKE